MKELQVLVAAMGQKDFSLAEKMNLRRDAIIANQCDEESVKTMALPQGEIKMISTTTRGVGKNRNIALLASQAELVLFADDDVCYYDGTLQGVVDAFRELPQADVIIFSVDILRGGKITEKRHHKLRRLHLHNAMKFGTYAIAARSSALLKNRINFHQGFGGGCIYGSGEDSLLIRACLKSGMKLYSHGYVLGTCCKDSSSWFTGHNEKYCFDKGALMNQCFPLLKYPVCLFFSWKLRKRTEFGFWTVLTWMCRGVRAGKTMTSFAQYMESKKPS